MAWLHRELARVKKDEFGAAHLTSKVLTEGLLMKTRFPATTTTALLACFLTSGATEADGWFLMSLPWKRPWGEPWLVT